VALYYYTASKSVYNEVPNLSTLYQARPSDDAAIKKEAREFKTEQYMRDWVPPVLLRSFYRARRGMFKVARGLRGA
jgi:hypothetical protein